jgi:hypothetical protein
MSPTITGIEAPPRFTRFELAYLLAGRDDVSARTSREVFGIPEVAEGDATLEAGLSSLVARGLIEEDQTSLLPRNEAGLVGFALGTTREWISLVVRVPEGVDVVVFFQGEKVAMMGRGAPAATLDFVPIRPETSAREAARDAVARLLGRQDVDLMIRAADRESRSALFIRVRPEGLGLGKDPVFPGDEEWPAADLEIVAASRGEVDRAVDGLLDSLAGGNA